MSIPPAAALAGIFLVPALETAVVLGFVLPGELTVVLGGVLASRGRLPLSAVLAASVLGPLAGDVVGYRLGRRYGEAVVRKRLGRRWERAHRQLSRKGPAVFLGRFLPFVRTVLPLTAGAVGMPARRFLPWDLAAAAVWGIASSLLGFLAGRELETFLRITGLIGWSLAATALLALALAAWKWFPSRHRGKRSR